MTATYQDLMDAVQPMVTNSATDIFEVTINPADMGTLVPALTGLKFADSVVWTPVGPIRFKVEPQMPQGQLLATTIDPQDWYIEELEKEIEGDTWVLGFKERALERNLKVREMRAQKARESEL